MEKNISYFPKTSKDDKAFLFISELVEEFGHFEKIDDVLIKAAKFSSEYLCDWCIIDFFCGKKKIKSIAAKKKLRGVIYTDITYRRPESIKNLFKYGVKNVYETKKSLIINSKFSKKTIENLNKSKADFEILQDAKDPVSILIAPVIIKNDVTMILTLVSTKSRRKYSLWDRRIVKMFASKLSSTIQRVRYYEDIINSKYKLEEIINDIPGIVWEAYKTNNSDPLLADIKIFGTHINTLTQSQWKTISVGKWMKTVHPDDKLRFKQEFINFMNTGENSVSTYRISAAGGEVRWVEAHRHPLIDENGNIYGARGVTMDVTDRVELERQKDNFIGLASHELKTPLATIKGYSHLLKRRFLVSYDKASLDYVSKIDEQTNNLTRLVNDLLNVSRIVADKFPIKSEVVNIGDILKNCVENVQMSSTKHHILLERNDDALVNIDIAKFEEVITNLITNAIKYSPKGDKVIVKSRKDNHHIIISVQDFGIGIPRDKQKMIFKKFFRVNDQSTTPGLGLGLYIADVIIRKLNGRIWLKSDLNKGTTFFISLPVITSLYPETL